MIDKTILIIDDNPANRYDLKTRLWDLGCTVDESQEEAEIITNIVLNKPNTVFVSLDFAKAQNFELLHKIKELTDCELIVYGNQISEADLKQCMKASVSDVVLDPCNQPQRLQDIVSLQ